MNLNKVSNVVASIAGIAVSVAIGTTAFAHTVKTLRSLKKKDKVVIHFYEDQTDVMPGHKEADSEPVEADSSDVSEETVEKPVRKSKKA